ncbi:MAG: 1,4-dihydroxy-2-naphthoate octaprenyltransferase [Bacteroidetes bacterium HGW-Bacteroidetes-1]|nr:MAG: 1,4-dihydroxy-2-naphthoate octaprenyltransferase [Bacteroidetes bacterium HGW-Bacteroidetes-1]
MHSWIKAARLRTLPLASASIALGGFLARLQPSFNLNAVIFAGITTLFLQILSNLANDYGDSRSGIDNKNRIGPLRTVQSGEITHRSMKSAILIVSFLALLSGIILVLWVAEIPLFSRIGFLLLGFGAIVAAIKYTVGQKPYGYRGLGDLSVFLFFGLLGVAGTFYVATNTFDLTLLLPASAMGLLSTGVLNLNNLRDFDNDKSSGKRTMVVSMGYINALKYHTLLILLPFVFLGVFSYTYLTGLWPYTFILLLPLFVKDLVEIKKIENLAHLDPYLKKLALKTLLLTLVFGITILL